jgi:hypothetical protein
MSIFLYKRSAIDTNKWDKCIAKSFNGIVYGFSWYLDIVSDNWEALVEDDYVRVMPLVYRVKYKISFIYQPFFTQQLGVFSTAKLDSLVIHKFLSQIPDRYSRIQMNLNTFCKYDAQTFQKKNNVTYQLDLIKPYGKIAASYTLNNKRNIKKAQEAGIKVSLGMSPDDFIELFHKNLHDKITVLKDAHYKILKKIISFAFQFNIGRIYCARDGQNQLQGAAFFILSHNKSIMLAAVSTEEGKENKAMFAIIDEYIRIHAEAYQILDFEGSNIEGVARFYAGFGAQPCEYTTILLNRLPWLIKLFKK